MLTRQEAVDRVDEIKEYALSRGKSLESWRWYYNHIFGVALIAQKIAEKLGLDSERAFVLGLLHDCGKLYERHQHRFHGVIGYEQFKDTDPQLALISLNHSYKYNFIDSYVELKDSYFNKKEDYDFTCDFLKTKECDIYSLLIQLCDTLANKDGFVTIEERIAEFEARNPNGWLEGQKKRLFDLKKFFDEKLGFNLYQLYQETSHDYFY